MNLGQNNMALSRIQLKSIIKECLFEILKEGLGDVTAPMNENRAQRQAPQTRPQQMSLRQASAPSPQQQKEDMLEDIFRDTANTTLTKQMASEQSAPKYVREGINHTDGGSEKSPPQGADRWELLAFADKGK